MNHLLGWCTEIDDAEFLHRTGYDYIECPVQSLKLEDAEASKRMVDRYRNSPLPVRAVNQFFPSDLRIVGPEVNRVRVQQYIRSVAEALHIIGARIAVMGSGGARSIPDGWDNERAQEQIMQVFYWISTAFKGSGVTLAIEPLNRKESNIINSVSEAVSYARKINHETVRVLADFYHMDEESEPLETLIDNREWLTHIHVADSGRLSPGTGTYPYADFFSKLRAAGFQGMISAECKTTNFAVDVEESLSFLRGISS